MRKALSALVLLSVLALPAWSESKSSSSKEKKQSLVARGEYLVWVGGCHDCHSPKAKPGSIEPDPTRLLAGRPATTPPPSKPANMGEITASGDLTAWYGPWGISYTANLTPHPTTGIGKRYNEASFIKTLRTGKKPEGEPLLPPMPWENFAKMSDADIKAIWAYLQTVKPVDNFVRAAAPPAQASR
jgi:cytochrome c553